MEFFGTWILDERKFISHSDLARLRRHVRGRVQRVGFKRRLPWVEWFLVELALETGLRVFEMASLNCSDLVIGISRPGVMVRHGKGGKPRFVRIRRAFARDCEDFLNWKMAMGESVDGEAPVFLSSATKGHMTKRSLQKAFARICKRTRIAGHSIHHCRHTYATYLDKASGHNVRFVQKQLGHSSMKTTQTYLHVLEREASRAMEKLYA